MPRAEPSYRRRLAIILFAAAVLRLVPIWFGLPYPYARPDEEVAIGHAVNVLGGAYNPEFFHWPSLTFYFFAVCFRIAAAVRQLVGLGPPTYVTDLLVARGTIAIIGALTVGVVYALTRRIASASTAIVAALFLAVAPLHVRDSHFAMTDVLATFLVVSSIHFLVRAVDDPSPRRFAVSGFVGGLAASTKYTAGAVAASMVAAQLAIDWRRWRPTAVFAAAAAAGFLVGTPYALLDFSTFWDGFTYDFTHLASGHNDLHIGVGWTYHLTRSLPAALSWPIFVLGIIGFVPMALRNGRAAAIVGALCFVVYASLGPGHTVFFRYVLPVVPLLCVAAAFAIDSTKWPSIAWIIAAPALVTSVWSDVLLSRPDTRALAAEWLIARVKPGESLYQAGSNYSDVPLAPLLPQTWPRGAFDAERATFAAATLPDWLIIPQSPLAMYTAVPESLRTIASQQYEISHRVRSTRPDVDDAGVYDLDDAFFLPVTGFAAVLRPGPTIVIYHRLAR